MTDIDTLEGAALNRAVAEALGWVNVTDGIYNGSRGIFGTPPGYLGPYKQMIPDYAHDLNAAVALPCERTLQLSITPDGLAKANYDGLWTDLPPTIPATAVSRAWLLYGEMLAARAERDATQERREQGRQGDKL